MIVIVAIIGCSCDPRNSRCHALMYPDYDRLWGSQSLTAQLESDDQGWGREIGGRILMLLFIEWPQLRILIWCSPLVIITTTFGDTKNGAQTRFGGWEERHHGYYGYTNEAPPIMTRYYKLDMENWYKILLLLRRNQFQYNAKSIGCLSPKRHR